MTTAHYKQVPPDEALRLNAEADKAGKPSPAINEEGPIHPLYAYLYVADKYEGLILVNAATLLDGDPRNNFLKRGTDIQSRRRSHRCEQHHDRRQLRLHHDRQASS